MAGRPCTVADVRAAYDARKRADERAGDLPAYLLYRPLSFWLTPPLVRLGVPPTAVTLAGGLLPLLMVAIAWRGPPRAWAWVAGLGFLWHVVDCVDGNVARVTGRCTAVGAVTDGAVDVLYWLCLFTAAGLLVEAQGGGVLGAWGLELALGCGLLVLWNHRLRAHLAELEAAGAAAPAPPRPWGPASALEVLLGGLEHLYVLALAAGGAAGRLDLVLAGVAAYVGGVFFYVLAGTLRRAARLDAARAAPDGRVVAPEGRP